MPPLITTRAADACVRHVLVQHGTISIGGAAEVDYEKELGFGLVGGVSSNKIGDLDNTETSEYDDDSGAPLSS